MIEILTLFQGDGIDLNAIIATGIGLFVGLLVRKCLLFPSNIFKII